MEAPASWLAMAPMAALAGLMIWTLRTEIESGLPSWATFPWWGMAVGLLFVGLGPVIAVQVFLAAGRNRIELDDEGLRLVRVGRVSRWLWSEIGLAEMRRVRSKWSAKQRPVLIFEAPRNGIGSAFLRWALNIDNRRLAVIEDIYDTSLDEIAEALNGRRRKLGGRVARRPAG